MDLPPDRRMIFVDMRVDTFGLLSASAHSVDTALPHGDGEEKSRGAMKTMERGRGAMENGNEDCMR